MRDCRTIVSFGFEDNYVQKRDKLSRLLFKNKRETAESNMHSTLKVTGQTEENPSGEISIANGLLKCIELFARLPLYYKKEILLVTGSAGTNDAPDVYQAIDRLAKNQVSISVFTIAGHMYLWDRLTERTGGYVYQTVSQALLEERLLVTLTRTSPTLNTS